MLRILFGSYFLLVAVSCVSSKRMNNNQQIACASKHVEGVHLDWIIQKPADFKAPSNFQMPANYSLYTIDSIQLQRFFLRNNASLKTLVPLPLQKECVIVSLTESGTLSEELKKKYPKMITLQGKMDGAPLSDVRIEYDGTKMKGQIKSGDHLYLITPVASGARIFYIVYDKATSGIPKQPFEK